MRTSALLLIIALILTGTAVFGTVEIQDTGAKEAPVRGHNYSKVSRNITFNNNGPVTYSLFYSYINDPEYTKVNSKAILPVIGDVSASTSGLGMDYPWFRSGFLGVDINRKLLVRTIASEFNAVETGKRAVYDVTWTPEWGDIRARFISMQDDDKLYLEVSIAPRVQVSSIGLKFVCVPGGFTKKKDQWLSTAERSVQHGPDAVTLDTKKEPWVLYYDTLDTSTGSCALMYLPEEVSDVKVGMSSNVTDMTYITYPASTRKMRFVLCSFPEKYKSRQEALSFLKENGEDMLGELKKIDFGK